MLANPSTSQIWKKKHDHGCMTEQITTKAQKQNTHIHSKYWDKMLHPEATLPLHLHKVWIESKFD
jgi:hypothetical protein